MTVVTSPPCKARIDSVAIAGWIGSVLALIGSALLAVNIPESGFGFGFYLLSNFAWIYHGVKTKTWSLVVMQMGFTVTGVLGLIRWVL